MSGLIHTASLYPVTDKFGRVMMFLDTVMFNGREGEVIGFAHDPIFPGKEIAVVQFLDGETINVHGQMLEQTVSPLNSLFRFSPIRFTPYGSRNYGTATEDSDYDFIGVCRTANMPTTQLTNIVTGSGKKVDVTMYGEDKYLEGIYGCEISILECLAVDYPNGPLPIFDMKALRHSISQKASNSWVKGKKKMTVEADFDMYIAKKSLFHSLRILKFGTLIATTGNIPMKEMAATLLPSLWDQIQNIEGGWDEHDAVLRDLHHKYASEFRAVCPK